MTDGLDGSVVVVTGAAGGVGHAVSRWLIARGAQVFDLDRRQPSEVAGQFVAVDVGDPASVDHAVEEVLGQAGRIDGLVVAAGLSEEPTPAEEMSAEVWQRTIGVNLSGAFHTCQRVGRVMLAQGTGRIVTIASMSGAHIVNVPQQQVAYNASKAGLVAMTKSLAYEWAGRGVRVNALSPGYIDTPLLASKAFLHDQWKAATPLGRFAEPHEVAAAAGWLLSDDATFCCGTELLMDGGYSLA
jgi:NAD(P)-dependent dehydrogenase (short-subunit alcohol dehydrogenase family)